MEYKYWQENLKLPVIWLWTWWIGGFMESDDSHDDTSVVSIEEAIQLWYTHIDTAELYGAGHTEELIGEAIKKFGRSDLIITSKVFKTHLSYNDTIRACEESLERLWTDYINIYLIHAPNPDIPLSETMRAMDELKERWLIRHIWVSNFSVREMIEAQWYSKYPIVVNQIPYNLATRNRDNRWPCTGMEREIIPYCQEHNILIMAYRPIERGLLLEPHPLIQSLSKKYQKTPAQIAMNWLLSKDNIITIPKSIDTHHLIENLGSIGWIMEAEDVLELNKIRFDGYL